MGGAHFIADALFGVQSSQHGRVERICGCATSDLHSASYGPLGHYVAARCDYRDAFVHLFTLPFCRFNVVAALMGCASKES